MAKSLDEITQMAEEMFGPELSAEVIKSILAENLEEGGLGPRVGATKSLTKMFTSGPLYKSTKVGKFKGLPRVVWNGMFKKGKTPRFVYQSDPGNEFRFIRHNGQAIKPRKMDTDGGSIPRLLHGQYQYDPWTYAPGYIIHDWIFTAHKCNHAPDDQISFEESATILAECIKTQMEVGFKDYDGKAVKFPKRKFTLYLIHLAVSSSIARKLWNKTNSVKCR